jgi:hypothetical protein
MLGIIEEKLTEIRATAMAQSNMVANELNSGIDDMNASLLRFNAAMETVRQKRAEADDLQAKAIRDLDTSIANNLATQAGIVHQLANGRMVTGSDTPVIPTRKPPKLVKGGVSAGGEQ